MEKIVIEKNPYFVPRDILECGQIFRYKKTEIGGYEVFSTDKHAFIEPIKNGWEVVSEDAGFFSHFFDLDTDYEKIISDLSNQSPILKQATEFGKGIRILNQSVEEMIFSFIISANNNIKRIQQIIERICAELGEKTRYGYAFPTVEAMASQDEKFYSNMGCGYRAPYIVDTAKKMLDGFDIGILKSCPTKDAKQMLLTLKGVGEKVADCILLFGARRTDVFPVDTWIKKVYHNYFETGLCDGKIAEFFVNKFKELSGFAQQYLFYFSRTMDK